jgi:hypothetical protein
LPAETLDAWAAAPPHAALHLPPPNRFLPDDLSLVPAAAAPASAASAAPAAATDAAAADADDDAADDDADDDDDDDHASASVSAGLHRPRRPTRLTPNDAVGRTVRQLDGDAHCGA